ILKVALFLILSIFRLFTLNSLLILGKEFIIEVQLSINGVNLIYENRSTNAQNRDSGSSFLSYSFIIQFSIRQCFSCDFSNFCFAAFCQAIYKNTERSYYS